jgi:hypothetical protein
MQIEFIIILQILGLISLIYGHSKKASLFTVFGAVVFGILAISYFNVEKTILVSDSTTISYDNDSSDLVNYTYREEVKQFSEIPMAFLNVGLIGVALLFFYMDTFSEGFDIGEK